jgi:outer membrane receptor protein involved in Fe transport
MDNLSQKNTYTRNPHDLDGLLGQYRPGLAKNNIQQNEFLLMFNKDVNEDFNVAANLGGSDFKEKRYSLNAKTYKGFANPGLFAIANTDGELLNPNEGFYDKQTRSIYGTLDFAYKNFLFLQLTGRNDWSSTLPQGANSYFYPSVSSSFVFSDVVELPTFMSSGKVRASYAKASTDDAPYQLDPTYSIGSWFGLPYAAVKGTIPPANLKPQETFAFETGFDIGLLNEKVFLAFSYYNNVSENQILSGPVAISSGFSSKKFNTGSITNSGVELTVNAFPVVTDDFKWEVIFNYAKNSNKVNSLDDDGGVDVFRLGGIWGGNGVSIEAEKGEAYGSIRGWGFIRDDATGKMLIDDSGVPYTTNQRVTLGNITPDWLGGLINTFN